MIFGDYIPPKIMGCSQFPMPSSLLSCVSKEVPWSCMTWGSESWSRSYTTCQVRATTSRHHWLNHIIGVVHKGLLPRRAPVFVEQLDVVAWHSSNSKIPLNWHDDSLQMEILSALLALREGNPLVTGGSPPPHKGQWHGAFNVFIDLQLNKQLS